MAFFPQQKYQRFGKYVLLDRINVGGMAEVFRGKTTGVEGFSKLVALKRILPNIAEDEDFIEMFIDEAKLAVQLQHANIVQIFDLGQADNRYFIAMEYVSGVDLRSVWDRARRRNRLLPIAMSCYIVQRMCEGLDYAHRKKDDGGGEIGLVHRDVSPQNVLLSYEGEVKVVDFGIALARHKVSKTQAGVLKGKFGYMSPEQVRGVELDHRSDIFACGIVLWELLVGDRLFLGESDFSTLEKVRNVEMVPPTHFNKNLSPQVERIVMKALAKNRDDRYRHASEMAEDLQRYLFASNQPFARTDLQRYMHQHFEEEIKAEQDRLEKYKTINDADLGPTPEAQPEVGPGLGIAAMPTQAAPLVEEMPVHGGRVPSALKARPITFSGPLAQQQAATPLARIGGPPVEERRNGHVQQLPAQPEAPPPPSPGWLKPVIAAMLGSTVLILAVVVWLLFGRAPELGSLSVDVTPAGAEIFLNDSKVATGDRYSTETIEPGTYVLTVKKAGFKDAVRPIRIQGGEGTSESIVLEAVEGSGSIFVRTTPAELEVWLDGKDTGKRSPIALGQLDAGEHELVLKKAGEVVYRAPITLAHGGAEAVDVDITRLPPILEVLATESDSEVLIDGKKFGPPPARIDTLRPGRVAVQVKKKGCTTYAEKVELRAAITTKVTAKLTCK